MLKEANADFTYREYTKDPLTSAELREVLAKLGMSVGEVLRKGEAVKAGFTGKESDSVLIEAIVTHPRMLQRPIAILGDRAELGRPVDNIARLLS